MSDFTLTTESTLISISVDYTPTSAAALYDGKDNNSDRKYLPVSAFVVDAEM